MTQAGKTGDPFQTGEAIAAITRCLRLNTAVCRALGNAFLPQMGRIYLDMLGLYKAASDAMKVTARQGPQPTEERMRRMLRLRGVKVEILKLIEGMFIECEDVPSLDANFLPPLLETLSLDYAGSTPSFREANVLRTLGAISARLRVSFMPILRVATKFIYSCCRKHCLPMCQHYSCLLLSQQ
jgi:exportin-1